jgi:hypothetical protein
MLPIGPDAATRSTARVLESSSVHRLPSTRPLSPRLAGVPRISSSGPLPPPGWETNILDELGAALSDARVGEGGAALAARMDELPDATVEQLGVAALTFEELYGSSFRTGLCEDARIELELEEDGVPYEADLVLPAHMSFVNEIEAAMEDLPDACIDALLEAKGDVELALADGGCVEEDEIMFFAEDSECRDCLEDQAGDYEACVDDRDCPDEAPLVTWFEETPGEKTWYGMAEAYLWACAPDWTLYTLVLGNIETDGTLPRAFDHESWAYLCMPLWDPATEAAQFLCFPGAGGPQRGDTLAIGVAGRVMSIHEKGSNELLHRDRPYYSPRVTMENGAELRWMWGWTPGLGELSLPPIEPDSNGNGKYDIEDENYGFPLAGWGLDPFALRPDGTDPDDLDDTFARDWLATLTLKLSTTADGVIIGTYNYNRCAAWDGPDETGAWWCREQGEPTYGFHNDGQSVWTDASFVSSYTLPMATIGSTGLPDPLVPGGVVTLIAGTDALANPDWDDCAWPHRFVPDWVPYEDAPGGFGGPTSLWGHTYKFGKDPDLDLRVVLHTNIERGFCAEDP